MQIIDENYFKNFKMKSAVPSTRNGKHILLVRRKKSLFIADREAIYAEYHSSNLSCYFPEHVKFFSPKCEFQWNNVAVTFKRIKT